MTPTIESVRSMRELREFIEFSKRLYASSSQWVPPFDLDYRNFYRRKHPFFKHAEGEFLLARRGSEVVGRVLAIRNDRYNVEHDRTCAEFYFLDFQDDEDVVSALFAALESWAAERGLNELLGPLFSGVTFGGGVLIMGFEHRAAMTMMPYNHPYYAAHYERAGFSKDFDLNSLSVDPKTFVLPEKVERLANHVRERGRMKVVEFRSKADLKRVAEKVGELYNPTLADHYENYPLTNEEIDQVIKDLLQIAQPALEKVITYDGEVIGYMLAFPDVTPAIQASHGRLTPRSILALMRASKRTKKLILNGMGILEKYQRLGGNALIYSELVRTLRATPSYDFDEAEMVQINEQTDLMLADMRRLGATDYKLHRVYSKKF